MDVDRRWFAAIGLIALTLGAAAEAGAGGDGPKTSLVSRQSSAAGGAGANDESNNPSTSATGRFTAFESDADNLSGVENEGVTNVFVYDRRERRVELISRRSNGGAGADDFSSSPEISPSGRYVVFESDADNLGGPIDTDVDNIYVYDRRRDKVRLVSRRSGSGAGGNGDVSGGSPSADGRYVVFTTFADNLGGPLAHDGENVYVYDLERRRVQLVSRRSGRNGAGANDSSFNGSLSANGRYVALATQATNLGGPLQTDPLDSDSNVYVYDRERRRVKLVSRRSRAAGAAGGDDSSGDPFISQNGRFVGFETDATNLGGPLGTAAPESNIYVYDLDRRRVALVSRRSQSAGGEGADAPSDDPVLSRDGRFVAFETNARNLGGPLNNADFNDSVYLYDRERRRVALVSRQSAAAGGDGGNDDDEDPYVSADGSAVAFEAESDNLGGPIDALASNHIYLRLR